MVLAGIPIQRALKVKGFELLVFQAVNKEVHKLMREEQKSLANSIANAVGELFSN